MEKWQRLSFFEVRKINLHLWWWESLPKIDSERHHSVLLIGALCCFLCCWRIFMMGWLRVDRFRSSNVLEGVPLALSLLLKTIKDISDIMSGCRQDDLELYCCLSLHLSFNDTIWFVTSYNRSNQLDHLWCNHLKRPWNTFIWISSYPRCLPSRDIKSWLGAQRRPRINIDSKSLLTIRPNKEW